MIIILIKEVREFSYVLEIIYRFTFFLTSNIFMLNNYEYENLK